MWQWQYTPYNMVLGFSTLLAFILGFYIWPRRHNLGGRPLCALMFGVALWSLGAELEMASVPLEQKLLSIKLLYLGVVIAPASLMLFSIEFSGERISLRQHGWLLVEPLLVLLFVWNDALHPFFWERFELVETASFVVFTSHKALGFNLHAVYSYALMVWGLVRMIRTYRTAHGAYRKQVGAIIIALLLPWISNAFYLSPINPIPYLDVTPIAFAFTGILCSVSLLRFRLFDLTPVARDTLIDNMDFGVLVFDEAQRVVDLNPAGSRMLDFKGDAVGASIDRVAPEIAAWAVPHLGQMHREELSLSIAGRICETVLFPLHEAKGTVRGHMVVLQDVSERHKRESEAVMTRQMREHIWQMQSSRDLVGVFSHGLTMFRQLNIPLGKCGLYVFDRPGDPSRSAMYRCDSDGLHVEGPLSGVEASEAFVTVWKDGRICHRADEIGADAHRQRVAPELACEGIRSSVEVPLPNGLLVVNSTNNDAFAGEVADQVEGIAELFSEALIRLLDIRSSERYLTQLEGEVEQRRRTMEELRVSKEQAELAVEAKGQFLANMSHELRTPMSAVLGITELLLDEDLKPDHHDQLRTIYSSADHLLKLLNQLLDLSSMEREVFQLESAPFALYDCVDEAVRMMRPIAEGKSLQLTLDLDEATRNTYVGDAGRLRQVLVNLLGNAVKFTREGSVQVRVELVESKPEGDALRIAVKDTGIGIPADKQVVIFDAFTQVDLSTTREFGGSGLGLAICQQIIGRLGSRVELESEVGVGSTFHFTITLARSATPSQPQQREIEQVAESGVPRRVLLAEDVLVNQKIVQAMLGKYGHEVVTVDTGLAAVDLLETDRNFDMVFMDMHMPLMGGIEATEKIRQAERDRGLSPLKISALTANAMEDDRQLCLAAGMDYYLAKPFRAGELLALIEQKA